MNLWKSLHHSFSSQLQFSILLGIFLKKMQHTVIQSVCRRIQPSILTPYHLRANCIQATGNKIIELNISPFYCVVQYSAHDPQWFLLLTWKLKGSDLPTHESGFALTSKPTAAASINIMFKKIVLVHNYVTRSLFNEKFNVIKNWRHEKNLSAALIETCIPLPV